MARAKPRKADEPLPDLDVWGQLGAVEGFQFCETMDTQSDPLVYDALYPGDGWRSWIKQYFPHVASKPFAKRHERVWDWFDSLEFNCPPPDPDIEIWGRGGAKRRRKVDDA